MTRDPPATLAETHSAVLVLMGDRAYKVKKPVDLGFLDFSTRQLREEACHREVRLNRRMAGDVYLGVADVRGPDGELCDHLVVMRRLPGEERMSTLVTSGHDLRPALWSVAHQLAALHAASPAAGRFADVARVATVRRHWRENLAVLADRVLALRPEHRPDHIEDLVERYLRGRDALFEERIAIGCVVDGHGDLRAEDVFVTPDGPRVLDCLDFSDELRWGDRLLDAAFLAMDLDDLGRPDLAGAFLAWQRELSGDTWPESLAHHYIAYRASVRAKVAAIKAAQREDPAAGEVERYCELTVRHLEAGRVGLILIGGLPGTGKTSLARGIGERSGAVVLSSDEVRRELGEPVTGSPPGVDEGRYAPAARLAVYDEMLARAGALLRRGERVVLDASWADGPVRRRARDLAEATSSDLYELCCTVPPAVAEARIAARRADNTTASEATVDVARSMAARFDAWPEAHLVDTDAPLSAVIHSASKHLGPGPFLVPR